LTGPQYFAPLSIHRLPVFWRAVDAFFVFAAVLIAASAANMVKI